METKQVLVIVAFQLVPELFLDFYCTFMEIYGGLRVVHEALWSKNAGRKKNHKYFYFRHGDMPKWLYTKFFVTVLFLCNSIIVCIKKP